VDKIIKYAIEKHYRAGNKYGEHEYDYHLNMVYIEGKHYFKEMNIPSNECLVYSKAIWCHDILTDTGVSREELRKVIGGEAEDIVWCVSGFGNNRKERNKNEINKTKNNRKAVFVKLCDRLANVKKSKHTNKNLFEMYKKEHTQFKKILYIKGEYDLMWENLSDLFKY